MLEHTKFSGCVLAHLWKCWDVFCWESNRTRTIYSVSTILFRELIQLGHGNSRTKECDILQSSRNVLRIICPERKTVDLPLPETDPYIYLQQTLFKITQIDHSKTFCSSGTAKGNYIPVYRIVLIYIQSSFDCSRPCSCLIYPASTGTQSSSQW